MKKVVIVEHYRKGRHSTAGWIKRKRRAAWVEQHGKKDTYSISVENVDIAQQRGKNGHKGASWKRYTKPQQRGNNSHSAAAWEKET